MIDGIFNSLVLIALATTLGALFGAPLVGLAVGLAAVFVAR